MSRTKLVVALILALAAVIIVVQNTDSMDTRLLFATVTMPRALLLIICIAIGFVLGLLFSVIAARKKKAE